MGDFSAGIVMSEESIESWQEGQDVAPTPREPPDSSTQQPTTDSDPLIHLPSSATSSTDRPEIKVKAGIWYNQATGPETSSVTEEQFLKIASNEAPRLLFRRQVMDLYFRYTIEMFPDSRSLWTSGRRYFQLQEQSVRQRFPIDEDVRCWMASLRLVFRGNLLRYLILKRMILALFIVAVLYLLIPYFRILVPMGPNLRDMPDALGIFKWIWITTAFAAFVISNEFNRYFYGTALRDSCNNVDTRMLSRTSDIMRAVGQLSGRLGNDQLPERERNQQDSEWAKETEWWSLVLYWLAKRLEYLERSTEIEMWRIRRSHFWWQWLGLGLTGLIAGLTVTFLCIVWWVGMTPGSQGEFWISILLIFIASVASFQLSRWNPEIDDVKTNLDTDKWGKYGALNVHDTIGNQLRMDKERILQEIRNRR